MSTQTASQAWLFHGLYPRHVIIYLDGFTVPTVSQSKHFAHRLIYEAGGISAFNVALVLFTALGCLDYYEGMYFILWCLSVWICQYS